VVNMPCNYVADQIRFLSNVYRVLAWNFKFVL
jgi:hypothetical protein